MIIKKYISKTEEEAVETARKELGQGVVVMSVRQIKKKGIFGFMFSPQVEVTVALEKDNSEKPQPKAPTMTALEQLAAKQKEINEQKEAAMAANKSAQRGKTDNRAAETAGSEQPGAEKSGTEMLGAENTGNGKYGAENTGSGKNGSGKAGNGKYGSGKTGNGNYEPEKYVSERQNSENIVAEELRRREAIGTSRTVYSDIIPDEPENEETVNSAIEEKLDSLESLIKQRLDSADAREESEASLEDSAEDEQMKLTRLLYNMMIDNEVREKYANQIIEEAQKQTKPSMPVDYFLTTVYQKMILKFGQTSIIEPAATGPRVVYFVGPTGVGKTTTIAKLASKFCLEEKKKVALLTADTYRIAAAEQLRTYANILDIPCRVIYSADEIVEAYEEYIDYDYIFVDTAGHSHHNEEQRNNTNVVIHALEGKTDALVYLVLSATTKYKDLTSIADTYREMTDYRIIFTKLDETSCFGNLLNLKLYTEADLSYVTYGQNVPDDIDKFDPQSIVKKILGGGSSDR